MKITPQFVVDASTSFIYSWIPALLILWFLIARKANSSVVAPFVGFILGAAFSVLAGHTNSYTSTHLFPGEESFPYFFLVGVVEELIKFAASVLALFIVARGKWKEVLHANWLAQTLSGSLGFAASENFVYGIDGQGGIARIVPLIAHAYFAIFWGLGFYTASLEKNRLKSFIWVVLGLLEGITLHAFYDCLVSDSVIPKTWRPLSWIALGMAVALIIWLHRVYISKIIDPALQSVNSTPDDRATEKVKITKVMQFFGLFLPGSVHIVCKREYLAGFTFLLLSLILPYLILRFGLLEISFRSGEGISGDNLFLATLFVAVSAITSFFVVGLWSLWELKQSSNDMLENDKKKRLTAYFPLSTLFMCCLMMSFFLPVFEKGRSKQKEDNSKVVIKEIPLGITWEMEKETPQKPKSGERTEKSLTEQNSSISLSEKAPQNLSKKRQKEKHEEEDVKSKGVQNSENLHPNSVKEIPKVGYIGVQLSEIVFNGQTRTFVAFVYPGTSAERAGLKAGDLIVSIDDESSSGLNALEVSNLVRGPVGSSVLLTVYRDGVGEVKIRANRTGTLFSSENNQQIIPPKIKHGEL
jgi:RsiW-degrading membrane proteinase PrsW (M82 family)